MNYLVLYYEFFKIGLFAIGGGLATIPFLYNLCDKYEWFTKSELSNMIAVSESTPGPIGVNMATYTGFINGNYFGGIGLGVVGGIISTLGIITPSIIVILIIAKMLEKFKESKIVQDMFYTIRPSVIGLIGVAEYSIFKTTLFCNFEYFDYKIWIVFVPLCFCAFFFKKLHPIVLIVIGAVMGILLKGGI